ncbi:uncharacterized protein LOC115984958 [Quercus lobata]|uniref:uncharacterized protein LOC115984958 n=1 Tax=Quercus lobata TaxID=97700 RepID=UPI001246C965|nr:uncharacterized protein LOC115984958 [Quercus lobata]
MADQEQKALRDYSMPSVNGATLSIRRPAIQANNFEIKPAIIQMIQQTVQFRGLSQEDPNVYIANFMGICDTFKHNGVTDDAIRLRLFPFSLRDKAKVWLNPLPHGNITTWEELAQKFLAKYFPPAKIAKLRNDITTFIQFEGESLNEAWERYKDLLRRCPHHDLSAWLQVQTFYNGLGATNRSMVDAAASGALMSKTHEVAYELLEELASNNYQWPIERAMPRKIARVLELDSITSLAAQMKSFNDCQVGNPFAQSSYGQANYVSNFQRQNNPYSNTYNPGWRNHPNFSWRNNQGQAKPPQQFPQQEKKLTLEDMFMQFIQKTDVVIQNNSASIRNLEVQIGQLSSMLTNRTAGTLPSNTVTNPKEQAKAISLRSGRTYEEPKVTNAKQDEAVDNEESKMKEVKSEMKEVEQAEKTKENERASKSKRSREDTFETYSPSIYDPPIPFPQRLRKNNMDDQFSKFLSIFKQLHINIPLIEALEQMPKYAKFFKDIISKKRKLEEHETIMLTEESSAIL